MTCEARALDQRCTTGCPELIKRFKARQWRRPYGDTVQTETRKEIQGLQLCKVGIKRKSPSREAENE